MILQTLRDLSDLLASALGDGWLIVPALWLARCVRAFFKKNYTGTRSIPGSDNLFSFNTLIHEFRSNLTVV